MVESEYEVELIFESTEDEMKMLELKELLNIINDVYVGLHKNEDDILNYFHENDQYGVHLDERGDIYLNRDILRSEEELNKFIGAMERKGVFKDVRSQLRNHTSRSVNEDDLKIRRLSKESPLELVLLGKFSLVLFIWLSSRFDGEYEEIQRVEDEEVKEEYRRKKITYRGGDPSDIIEFIKNMFK